METGHVIEDIRRAIGDLRFKQREWEREIGHPDSAMSPYDIRFLDRQIAKLVRMEARVVVQLEDAVRAVAEVRQSIQQYLRDHPG
jgi:hypothetical protein